MHVLYIFVSVNTYVSMKCVGHSFDGGLISVCLKNSIQIPFLYSLPYILALCNSNVAHFCMAVICF